MSAGQYDPIGDAIEDARDFLGRRLTREEVGAWTPADLQRFADEITAEAELRAASAPFAACDGNGAAW